jgi:NADPH-dependent 7-cyano-7-deazaguanine reductase QueF
MILDIEYVIDKLEKKKCKKYKEAFNPGRD